MPVLSANKANLTGLSVPDPYVLIGTPPLPRFARAAMTVAQAAARAIRSVGLSGARV